MAYPNVAKYNEDTLLVMTTRKSMLTGRTLADFNNVSPWRDRIKSHSVAIASTTSLSTAQRWVDTAKSTARRSWSSRSRV